MRAQLEAYGVSPADAKARVAASTDAEAAELAAGIDTLPAGGFVQALAAVGYAFYWAFYLVFLSFAALIAGLNKLSQATNSKLSPAADQQE